LYAFGGFEGRLGVIDVATGTAVSPNELAHAGPISWVTFSPDSTTLATIGFDGQLTLSDVKAVTPSARVQPGRTNIRSTVAYANDGRTAVVAYEDGSVVSFTTDPDVWLAHACAVAGRNLDRGEWTAAFGARPYRQTCPTA
jgi:WD40 repeat protein